MTRSFRSPLFLALVVLGLVGNYFSAPIFFGYEFIFGSIANLIALALLGPASGLACAAITGTLTIYQWNHPYAFFAIFFESVFVAMVLKRLRSNIALASGLYWLTMGGFLVYIFYRWGLGMDHMSAFLVAVKQSANGVTNASIASIVLTYLPLLIKLDSSTHPRKLPVFQAIFNFFLSSALIPTFILVMTEGHKAIENLETKIKSQLTTISTATTLSLDQWRRQHIRAILLAAKMAQDLGRKKPQQLNLILSDMRSLWPDFHGVFFTDINGNTIAFDPLINTFNTSTIGLNFSDRYYFQFLKNGGAGPYVSPAFKARGGVFEPVFNISAPVYKNGKFDGIVAGSLNLNRIKQILTSVPNENDYRATLVDSEDKVITSSAPDLSPLQTFDLKDGFEIEQMPDEFYRRLPAEHNGVSPITQWSNSSIGLRVDIPGAGGWKLYVEVPLKSIKPELFFQYSRLLSFLLGLAMVILLSSFFLASRIANPISELSQKTTGLADRLQSQDDVQWPVSRMFEVSALVDNFKSMVNALKKRFEELEAQRNELDRLNRVKDEFLATLSHELRTPLHVILGHSEILNSESSKLSPQIRSSIEVIHRNAITQNQIIADLLDISAIITGKMNFHPAAVSINDIVKAALSTVRLAAESKNIRLECSLDAGSFLVYGDPTRLQQVIWNLLSNAVKFTPNGGLISISTLFGAEECKVTVSDNGKGIEPGFLPFVFDRFRQEDNSLSRNVGGLGIGLSIVKQLVELHGGSIHADSKGKDQGSTFVVTFPRKYKSAEIQPSQTQKPNQFKESSSPQPKLNGRHVLIVDDDPDSRELMTLMLNRWGAEVETASSSEEGLHAYQQAKPDLVISDIGMPQEDGFIFMRRLRALESSLGQRTPAIALTAYAGSDDINRCSIAGYQAHVPKPVQQTELLQAISSLI